MVAPFSKFYGKFWVGFGLNIRKGFFLEASFSSQQKDHRFFQKTVLGIFKIALLKILNTFSILTLKQIFWKAKTFFKKLEYRFLVERTKIEKASFPYKTAISEANVKTNRMVSTKWTYHKERSFASNYFIFLKILFQFKNLL